MKFRLLLLDANVVIYLHELKHWDRFVGEGEVILSRTVMEQESLFFEDDGEKNPIDLAPFEQDGCIKVIDVPLSEIQAFKNQFDVINIERLDPGEAESLAYLVDAQESHLFSSRSSSPDSGLCFQLPRSLWSCRMPDTTPVNWRAFLKWQ